MQSTDSHSVISNHVDSLPNLFSNDHVGLVFSIIVFHLQTPLFVVHELFVPRAPICHRLESDSSPRGYTTKPEDLDLVATAKYLVNRIGLAEKIASKV